LRTLLLALFLCFTTPLEAQPVTDPVIRADIEQLLAAMNQALDAEDYDAYVAVWAEDAIFESRVSDPVTGRDAVMACLRQNQEAGFITGKRHFISNPTLEEAGDNVLATYYLAVFERRIAPALIATALITDEFTQTDEGWRIVHHVTSIDPAMMNAMNSRNSQSDQ
jgi:ketosteroid isomerase-like protein